MPWQLAVHNKLFLSISYYKLKILYSNKIDHKIKEKQTHITKGKMKNMKKI